MYKSKGCYTTYTAVLLTYLKHEHENEHEHEHENKLETNGTKLIFMYASTYSNLLYPTHS